MTAPPSAQLANDPRFDEVFQRALAKHGLPDYLASPVRKLVLGEIDPRSFVCCNSGCTPCVKDYLGAAEAVLSKLGPRPKKKRWLFF